MALTVLYNGTVYTGITVLPKSTVIVDGERVVDVISNDRFHKRAYPTGTQILDLEGLIVCPGFIDTHIHGVHGYGTEDISTDSILGMSEALVQYGVTGFLPTLYPQDSEDFIRNISCSIDAMGQESGARILGLHLEGPFISPEKKGVQREEFIRSVDMDYVKRIYDAGREHISVMTVAPELKNMRELALYCNERGTVLSAGHTNANYEHMVEGFQAGILHATHMYNAMRSLHHRDPGAVGALLLHTNVSVELIADGFHVHPALVELLTRSKPMDKIVLVTDALKPTEQSTGTLIANGEEVYLDPIGVFRRKADDVIAGSSLTMNRGVKNLVSFGVDVESAIQMAASNPAELLGMRHSMGYLLPNALADIAILNSDFVVQMTYVGGQLRFNRFKHTVRDPQLGGKEDSSR